MCHFLKLPDELLLEILYYVCLDNLFETSSLASTCQRLCRLTADRTFWSGNVALIIDDHDSNSVYNNEQLPRLAHAIKCHGSNFRTTHLMLAATEQTKVGVVSFIQSLIQRQQSIPPLRSFELHVPLSLHGQLIQTLSRDVHRGRWTECTLRSEADEDKFKIMTKLNRPETLSWLQTSQTTLQVIDIPSLPIQWLEDCNFPAVKSLTVACQDNEDDGGDSIDIDWHRIKRAFPQLESLTLYINKAKTASCLQPLLTDRHLYPWIKTLAAVSSEDLRPSFNQEQLCQSLLTMNGLSRVNVGWDMVAID